MMKLSESDVYFQVRDIRRSVLRIYSRTGNIGKNGELVGLDKDRSGLDECGRF